MTTTLPRPKPRTETPEPKPEPRTVHVSVTPDHIKRGKRKDPDRCAINLALKEALRGYEHIETCWMLVYLRVSKRGYTIVWPCNIQDWIIDFDKGREVAPIEFDLELPAGLPVTGF